MWDKDPLKLSTLTKSNFPMRINNCLCQIIQTIKTAISDLRISLRASKESMIFRERQGLMMIDLHTELQNTHIDNSWGKDKKFWWVTLIMKRSSMRRKYMGEILKDGSQRTSLNLTLQGEVKILWVTPELKSLQIDFRLRTLRPRFLIKIISTIEENKNINHLITKLRGKIKLTANRMTLVSGRMNNWETKHLMKVLTTLVINFRTTLDWGEDTEILNLNWPAPNTRLPKAEWDLWKTPTKFLASQTLTDKKRVKTNPFG